MVSEWPGLTLRKTREDSVDNLAATMPRLLALTTLILLAACSTPQPNARVTGNGGSWFLKYSSTQTTVDLTDQERAALRLVQDERFSNTNGTAAMQASAAALTGMGFDPVHSDPDTLIVEGELNKVVNARWREIAYGLLKLKGIPLNAKPDHQSITALVTIRSDAGRKEMLVRARFNITVWDTDGDAQTVTLTEPDMYDDFFAYLGKSMQSRGIAPIASRHS